ncbi:MAG: alpha-1,4-glucan--maltose-1-phosphate maltosyltransferase [Methylotenera sp.]|uniref:alpha-1,4-glucan--maltose-1-phosphate maltosyltransferase n=1 Tax=Methylotenera sp. TaxID=2051956 RepID=UPI0024893ACD|nr:alpha-1,4-glucan--maltose-1-phosphate maltosyltransferase [Methylotenera sp.]MDI1308849.1 alpha-1,4-glucan--maltose-1-phosphate maltosyltransferase [Methylotenera sp.]
MNSDDGLSCHSSTINLADVTDKRRRIVIENFSPAIDAGRFTPKFLSNEPVNIEADIYIDSHDKLSCNLLWKQKKSKQWNVSPMQLINNDRWRCQVTFDNLGLFDLQVEAWLDNFANHLHKLLKKVEAKMDIKLELEEGVELIKKTLNLSHETTHDEVLAHLENYLCSYKNKPLDKASLTINSAFENYAIEADLLEYYDLKDTSALLLLLSNDIQTLHQTNCQKEFLTHSSIFPLRVERTQAEFSNWYEVFPRSQSGDSNRHGTFGDLMARLPHIKEMGFDTLYLTPIHPIGEKFRKGKNNSLICNVDDPGSPYAIGSHEGGHDAINSRIGSWQDFRCMRDAAKSINIEIALDFAIQCSPDHPWLTEHPEWFNWRLDGSLRYAENPPKKYQDIVNVDFYAPQAIPALWIALKDVVLFWANEGIRTFRVDNPHTKPFPFWEWLIAEVQDTFPDTIFLSEAFTSPKIMARLAKIGFTQSYTYFTWRNTKYELTSYLQELNEDGLADYFKPHFFVNTPDINPFYLQQHGRNGFLVRAALAASTSGLWGISSGFEICEAEAIEGKEEFKNSEKYEIRAWDWTSEGNIVSEISTLNRLRKTYKPLQTQQGIDFHFCDNDQVIFYSKKGKTHSEEKLDSLILVAVNLSANHLQEANLEVPLYMLGLHDNAQFEVHDLMSDSHFSLDGKWQKLCLDPSQYVFVIWHIKAREH